MIGHGNEKEQENKELFEDQLKEILYSGPDNNIQNFVETPESTVHHRHIEKKLSTSAEIIIRVIAAVVVIGLLICFGIQIAFR